jgi:hypothetical protein
VLRPKGARRWRTTLKVDQLTWQLGLSEIIILQVITMMSKHRQPSPTAVRQSPPSPLVTTMKTCIAPPVGASSALQKALLMSKHRQS